MGVKTGIQPQQAHSTRLARAPARDHKAAPRREIALRSESRTEMKTDWKILPVLLPGALLGAGAGALVAAFQFAEAASFAGLLQTTGIILMIGSIILRILLSERGLKLSDYGGLGINGICVLLAGVITIWLTSAILQAGSATGPLTIAAVVLSGIPALLLTAAGAFAFARLRQR
ncbi:MAG TPA: hypothetical protein VFV70_10470 [Hyphomonadaceae bacterium]|nr:hypothetical protein [Hyphomonadaceae bacterium]